MTRVLALLAAVAMVVGAVALRSTWQDDDATGGAADGDDLRLRCATELRAVCEDLATEGGIEVSVEDAGTTSDALVELAADADPGFDAWLVAGPWPAVTEDNRSFADADGPALGEPSPVLASSPAVMAARTGTLEELRSACGGEPTWRCVGEQPASLRVGLAPPEDAAGLVLLGAAAASWFDTPDISASDLSEPGFSAWFDRLTSLSAGTPLGQQTPLARALAAAGTFDVVGALESESADLLAERGGWEAIYPEPMSTAQVQLVPRRDLDAGDAVDRVGPERLRDALDAAGWRTGDDADGSAGLPPAGVLQILRETW